MLKKAAHAGVKEGYPLKSDYLSAVGLFNVKIVADKHIHPLIITSSGDELLRKVNIDDLE